MLGSSPWDTISVFASFSSCFHNDFHGIRSLAPFMAAGARLHWLSPLPASSGLMWGFWWSAVTHVMRFCVLFQILLCSLPYNLWLRFPYFFFFFLCIDYIFLLSFIIFFLICTMCCRVPVLMRPSGTTRHTGSCWPVLLALVLTLSFYCLVPRRLVSSLFQIDRHSVAWPYLPRSRDPPAFQLQRCLLPRDCR